jgi:hypothetical protein
MPGLSFVERRTMTMRSLCFRLPSSQRPRAAASRLVLAALVLGLLPVTIDAATVTIGSGSGMLSYDTAQETLTLHPGDTLAIAPGTYTGIALSNLHGTPTAPITVMCAPGTVFSSPHEGGDRRFANLSFVHFEDFTIDRGFTWLFTGASHDLLFKKFAITKGGGFIVYDPTKVFDGTKDSAFYNFTWEDCRFDGAGIRNSDWQSVSNMKSVLLDFDIHRCSFSNFDAGAGPALILGFDKAFNLQVHECTFSDIGMAKFVVGHGAVIVGSGYFKIYNNTFTRQWANDVRMFPMKLNALGYNGADAITSFYNNISYEKRKYPMFEQNSIRPDDLAKSSGMFSSTGSEIFFNTLYHSRRAATSGDPYCAQLVDIYAPDVVIKHNLIIEPDCDMPFDPKQDYVCHYGAGPQKGIVTENNLVFATLAESGLMNATTFTPSKTSPAHDAATGRIAFITTDHDGHPRYVGAAADVGAVERQETDR